MEVTETKKMTAEEIVENIRGKIKRHFGRELENASQEELYKASALCIRDDIMDKWSRTKQKIIQDGLKTVYYMSAEFLMGRAYTNNLINMNLEEEYQEAFRMIGLDLKTIADQEKDAGLGNGGLGRLAACFLDSLATLKLPAMGCGIRYEYGLFKQKIVDGAQIEAEDDWLSDGYVWEVEKAEYSVEVHFNGYVTEEWTENGLKITHRDYNTVIAVPYDVPVVGYNSEYPATLRLWGARATDEFDLNSFNRGEYTKAVMNRELAEIISKVLYPADDHDQGKQLRLKQFYFFTSATMQSMVNHHKKYYGDLHTLPKHAVIQINDTHPTLAMPELMRILMDEEGMGWDEAYDIVSQMFNYTNHTILSEALECWDESMFRLLLPRIYSIIQTINQKYCEILYRYYPGDMQKISKMAIVAYGQIRMANLCVAVTRRVNGVSQLHGDILKQELFQDADRIYPQKFLAVTNGITQRRWLALANPGLTKLMRNVLDEDFIEDYRVFERLLPYADDAAFRSDYAKVKRQNKDRLAEYLQKQQGVIINPDSLIDVQCKRLHEYKRQLMKCIHLLYLYNTLMENPNAITQPITMVFAAKAAPGYIRAKNIIRLIHAIADLVNKDPRTKDLLKVVFLENYRVSAAEILIPAADISEQISTAGLEASGTGNMKFMMNGAITLGTMDGANVEIYEQVGPENIFIFGATATEVSNMKKFRSYHPGEIFERNMIVRKAVDRLVDGTLSTVSRQQFSTLYQSLLFGDQEGADPYFVLYDLPAYIERFAQAVGTYQEQPEEWLRKAIINTAKSGYFSSDRTIEEYNAKIWGLSRFEA
ncbi:MAG: glycogen/starch/alpha-glucan phosphorylase [Lachnospiraceae bacterium]|nr:glycogen/starch/alpha-glucan phosphorylase [Lachnospiraceae bacterium]